MWVKSRYWPMSGVSLLYPQQQTFQIQHYATRSTGRLVPQPFLTASETQRSYRLGDLGRIFLVGISTPAGMTDRNVLNIMPRALARSDIPQCDHFPSIFSKSGGKVSRLRTGWLGREDS